ncbi:hypothetical protein ZEAMMB73_Zm00001d042716 [Zea mays]|uniref:Uncharacterized protein n=1 Tax=Zea mays TaxID=4577 RepID=A0A1D6N6B4_MAIZE|nr:hypothetical protein ZEAMMB73_Zm00001d042716 [Zea mays]
MLSDKYVLVVVQVPVLAVMDSIDHSRLQVNRQRPGFDEATGAFEIHLAGTCYVHFGSHLVYYERTITGKLSKGAISDLSGVQAQKLFLWVYVTGMVALPDQGTIEFQSGFISESLSASMFDEVPTCGSSVGAQLRGATGVIGELGLLPVAQFLSGTAPFVYETTAL